LSSDRKPRELRRYVFYAITALYNIPQHHISQVCCVKYKGEREDILRTSSTKCCLVSILCGHNYVSMLIYVNSV